jgi:hypothetical protein
VRIVTFARWFAVIVIALGLQVPGDLTFRVCLCEGLLGAGLSFTHECQPIVKRSCCDDETERGGPVEDAGCDDVAGCRCVLVHVPHRPDTSKVTPDTGVALARIDDRFSLPVRSDAELSRARVDGSRSRAHDPPWERANLPLRI